MSPMSSSTLQRAANFHAKFPPKRRKKYEVEHNFV